MDGIANFSMGGPNIRSLAWWALFVHAMRHMSPHYDHALQMPMPLHYARQVTEYIIDLGPHDENDEEE